MGRFGANLETRPFSDTETSDVTPSTNQIDHAAAEAMRAMGIHHPDSIAKHMQLIPIRAVIHNAQKVFDAAESQGREGSQAVLIMLQHLSQPGVFEAAMADCNDQIGGSGLIEYAKRHSIHGSTAVALVPRESEQGTGILALDTDCNQTTIGAEGMRNWVKELIRILPSAQYLSKLDQQVLINTFRQLCPERSFGEGFTSLSATHVQSLFHHSAHHCVDIGSVGDSIRALNEQNGQSVIPGIDKQAKPILQTRWFHIIAAQVSNEYLWAVNNPSQGDPVYCVGALLQRLERDDQNVLSRAFNDYNKGLFTRRELFEGSPTAQSGKNAQHLAQVWTPSGFYELDRRQLQALVGTMAGDFPKKLELHSIMAGAFDEACLMPFAERVSNIVDE
ncbi:MAG TPA: hypothetical protein VIT68_03275 [Candidatus Gracilibacteria bacterium]